MMAYKINYTGSSKILQRLCAAVNELIDNGTYTLPIASQDTLGGMKVGNNLSIDEDGVLSASGGGVDTVSVNQILSSGTKIAEITVGTSTTDLYAPAGGGGGGNAMWRVLFYNADGTDVLYREYVANGDDCIYGETGAWSDTVGGSAIQDVTKNITQNLSLYKVGKEALHFYTKSTGGNDASMYIAHGTYYNGQFSQDSVEDLIYTQASSGVSYDGIATLKYPYTSGYWGVTALDDVTDGTNNYSSGSLIKTWSYSTSVDFYVYKQ